MKDSFALLREIVNFESPSLLSGSMRTPQYSSLSRHRTLIIHVNVRESRSWTEALSSAKWFGFAREPKGTRDCE